MRRIVMLVKYSEPKLIERHRQEVNAKYKRTRGSGIIHMFFNHIVFNEILRIFTKIIK